MFRLSTSYILHKMQDCKNIFCRMIGKNTSAKEGSAHSRCEEHYQGRRVQSGSL